MAVQVYGKLGSVSIKKDPISIDKKIYGFAYPFGQNTNKGYFSRQSGVTLVRNNLMQLLNTVKGERVMLPDYGTNLINYLFEPLDEETFTGIRNSIVEAIGKYAPGVTILKLSIYPASTLTYDGVQGLKISLLVQLEELNETTEIQVTLG